MSATISGNVGGSSYQNAVISLQGNSSNGPVQQLAAGDSSGNYSFTIPYAGVYTLNALPITVSSVKYNYLTGHTVSVSTTDITNATTYGSINFQPTASNAANAPTF
jgi:hypothetical protein